MQNNHTNLSVLLSLMSAVLLTACAGNPPAWWNPSGTYGAVKETSVPISAAKSSIRSVRPVIQSAQPVEEIPSEEQIEAAVEEEYEELKLSPLMSTPTDEQAAEDPSATLSE